MIKFLVEYNWLLITQILIAYVFGIGAGYYYRKSKEPSK